MDDGTGDCSISEDTQSLLYSCLHSRKGMFQTEDICRKVQVISGIALKFCTDYIERNCEVYSKAGDTGMSTIPNEGY